MKKIATILLSSGTLDTEQPTPHNFNAFLSLLLCKLGDMEIEKNN